MLEGFYQLCNVLSWSATNWLKFGYIPVASNSELIINNYYVFLKLASVRSKIDRVLDLNVSPFICLPYLYM